METRGITITGNRKRVVCLGTSIMTKKIAEVLAANGFSIEKEDNSALAKLQASRIKEVERQYKMMNQIKQKNYKETYLEKRRPFR